MIKEGMCVLCFIWYEKVFDLHHKLIQFQKLDIDQKDIEILYWNQTAQIKLDNTIFNTIEEKWVKNVCFGGRRNEGEN